MNNGAAYQNGSAPEYTSALHEEKLIANQGAQNNRNMTGSNTSGNGNDNEEDNPNNSKKTDPS